MTLTITSRKPNTGHQQIAKRLLHAIQNAEPAERITAHGLDCLDYTDIDMVLEEIERQAPADTIRVMHTYRQIRHTNGARLTFK